MQHSLLTKVLLKKFKFVIIEETSDKIIVKSKPNGNDLPKAIFFIILAIAFIGTNLIVLNYIGLTIISLIFIFPLPFLIRQIFFITSGKEKVTFSLKNINVERTGFLPYSTFNYLTKHVYNFSHTKDLKLPTHRRDLKHQLNSGASPAFSFWYQKEEAEHICSWLSKKEANYVLTILKKKFGDNYPIFTNSFNYTTLFGIKIDKK